MYSQRATAAFAFVLLGLPASTAGPVDVGLDGSDLDRILREIKECNGYAFIDHIVPVLGHDTVGTRSGLLVGTNEEEEQGFFFSIGANQYPNGTFLYWMQGKAAGVDCFNDYAAPPFSQAHTLATCQLLDALEHVSGNEYAECKYNGPPFPFEDGGP